MFVEAGAKVIFNYQKAQEAADALVLELGSLSCYAVQADLDGEGAEQMLIEETVKRYGRLDALVVNHGIWPPSDQPIDEMTPEQWQGTMAVNLDSVFLLVKHSVAQMKQQREGGRIVLVSSTAGQRGEAFHCDYATTKGALIQMTRAIAVDFGAHGIRANAICPGPTLSGPLAGELLEGQPAEGASPEAASLELARQDPLAGKHPLGRIALPEDIAYAALFLASDESRHITGILLPVDGGFTAR
jgi:3-oxoacyl-[acyl-carrier protein] reductase